VDRIQKIARKTEEASPQTVTMVEMSVDDGMQTVSPLAAAVSMRSNLIPPHQ
jgi:hypothetical protein